MITCLMVLIIAFSSCKKEESKPYINFFQKELQNSYWNIGRIAITYEGVTDYDLEPRSWEFIKDSVRIKEFETPMDSLLVTYNDSGFVFHHPYPNKYLEVYKVNYIDSSKMVVVINTGNVTIIKNLYRNPEKKYK